MASLEELREQKRQLEAQQKQLDKEIELAKEIELKKAQEAVAKKIEEMTDEEKQFILAHMQHEGRSCAESVPQNGSSWHRNHWNCRKCMLMEIFNGEHGGRFDFELTVDIHEVTV